MLAQGEGICSEEHETRKDVSTGWRNM